MIRHGLAFLVASDYFPVKKLLHSLSNDIIASNRLSYVQSPIIIREKVAQNLKLDEPGKVRLLLFFHVLYQTALRYKVDLVKVIEVSFIAIIEG